MAAADSVPSATDPVRVSISHRLGRVEARRRIDDGLDRVQARVASLTRDVSYHWQEDVLHCTGRVMGQPVAARVTVREASVDVEVTLPQMLSMFSGMLTGQMKQQAQRLLDRE